MSRNRDSGGTLTGDEVRARLHSALDVVSPQERMVELATAVTRRRRTRRWLVGGAGVALVGSAAAALILTVAVPDRPASIQEPAHPRPPTVDARSSLAQYVLARHGTSVSGPIGADKPYAVYVEDSRLRLAQFDGQRWIATGPTVGSPEPGLPVVATHVAALPGLVAFQIDAAGADAVVNGLFVQTPTGWQYAEFDCGSTLVACANGPGVRTTFAYDGFIRRGQFHSEPNGCRPSCVQGTRYDVQWRWRRDPTSATGNVEFVVNLVHTVP